MCFCKLTKKVICLVVVLIVLVMVGVGIWLYQVLNSGSDVQQLVSKVISYEVLALYDHVHDPSVTSPIMSDISEVRPNDEKRFPFTQGIFFTGENKLIESEGLNGHTTLREFDLSSGKTLRYSNINRHFFGEGATIIIDPSTMKKLICQLTYKEKTIILYDYETFQLYNKLSFDFEGYGLASNYVISYNNEKIKSTNFLLNQQLWATTGDNYLYELNIPDDLKTAHAFTIKKKIPITCVGFKIDKINELEYNPSGNSLYGNIFTTDLIMEFKPTDGTCLKLIDMSGLMKHFESSKQYTHNVENVLNGIAIDPYTTDSDYPILYVTGKRWPKIFKITFRAADGDYLANVLRKHNFALDINKN